ARADIAWLPAVSPAPDVLVMDEVLHRVEALIQAGDAEDRQPGWAVADLVHQLPVGGADDQHAPHPLVVAGQRAAHQARRRVGPAPPEHEVSGQIQGLPALTQGGRPGTGLIQQRAQGGTLVTGEAHPAMVRPAVRSLPFTNRPATGSGPAFIGSG